MTSRWQDPCAKREASHYQHPIPSRELIIDYLNQCNKAISYHQLVTHFQLTTTEQQALKRRLRAMIRDAQIVRSARCSYTIMKSLPVIKGRIQAHRDGHGFIIPNDNSTQLFLPPRQMSQVFDNDVVLAKIVYIDRRGRGEATITEVLERAHDSIVGRYFCEKSDGFVVPANKRLINNIVIPAKQNKNANDGEMVVAKITAYPTKTSLAVGHIIKVLGSYMSPGIEIKTAMHAYHLSYQWSKAITTSLARLPNAPQKQDKHHRINLCHLPFITIDSEDAKDFDDAIYAEKRRLGGWRLYVAIADVSHYVKCDTALDKQALLRGNSVYFPSKVIPMLPEKLSQHLCSLNPHVERLSIVCEMLMTQSGAMTRYKFYEAIITSKARLNYNEVAAFFAGKKNAATHPLQSQLQLLHRLYIALNHHRLQHGAIYFNSHDVKVVFNTKGKIRRLVSVIQNDAHHLIEECMLCANVAAAKFLLKHKATGLYRVHHGPKLDRLDDLRAFLCELGLHLPGGSSPEPKDYARVLQQVSGRAEEHLVQTMLLRSLSQAFYTPNNSGHFGLAFKEYTHFTSPIRRYPDLLVHRAIKAILHNHTKTLLDNTTLLAMGRHCSEMERRADEATRDALNWLKCEYMLSKIGKTFCGVISSVTNFGIFVELNNIFIEGLVHVNALKDDHYHFDIARQRLLGERHGSSYRLGDPLEVKVIRVDLDDKKIDFELANSYFNGVKTTKKKRKQIKR